MSAGSDGRDDLRRRVVAALPRWYSHWTHLLGPAAIGAVAVAACLALLSGVTRAELAAAAAWLVACNAIEWSIHRNLLHRRSWAVYDKHLPEHHGIFRDHDMAIRTPREFALVLVPGYALFLLFVAFLPVAAALSLLSPNLALLFLAISISYVLAYEWMHLLYHLPVPRRGWPGAIEALRRHHAAHHDPKLMQEWNFNTTLPLWDRVRGTRYRSGAEASREPAG